MIDYEHAGYTSCKFWKDKGLLNDKMPLTDPPARGEDAVNIFLKADARQEAKDAFISGWNRYLTANQ